MNNKEIKIIMQLKKNFRRSHSLDVNSLLKNQSSKMQYYMMDNLSSIKDYLRLAPQKIKIVVGALAKERASERCEFSASVWATQTVEATFKPRFLSLEDWVLEYKELPSSSSYWLIIEEPLYDEKDLFKAVPVEEDFIIALDHLTDPMNLGNILRTAAYFGIKKVLLPKDRQVRLTQSAYHASAAALATSAVYYVTNLARVLEQLKEGGYWVLGADMSGESAADFKVHYAKKVLVLGNESNGISMLVKRCCDVKVGIKSSETERIDSLNVTNAAAILIFQLISVQQKQKV